LQVGPADLGDATPAELGKDDLLEVALVPPRDRRLVWLPGAVEDRRRLGLDTGKPRLRELA
jgi:hypothetical protein